MDHEGNRRMRKHNRRASDEADGSQLKLAAAEGRAYQKSLSYMVNEVADSGGRMQVDDYIVAYAQERAEGMYHLGPGGKLKWMEPPKNSNCHLEVSVSDAADRRFIPYLAVTATLFPTKGKKIGPFKIPFVWHPGLYHYGRNIHMPGDGVYRLVIEIDPAEFMRHDKENGRLYARRVVAEFPRVKIKAGRED